MKYSARKGGVEGFLFRSVFEANAPEYAYISRFFILRVSREERRSSFSLISILQLKRGSRQECFERQFLFSNGIRYRPPPCFRKSVSRQAGDSLDIKFEIIASILPQIFGYPLPR